MKHKKRALFQSVISLLLCFSMLVGTTFAWFTDSVVTGINTIAAGNLDVELFHSNAAVSNEQVDSNTKLFMDLQGDPILWEPGVVSYENLRVSNEGDLALAYQMAITTANENYIVEESGARYGLSQILKVGVVPGGVTATDRAGVVSSVEETNWTTLSDFIRSGSLLPDGAGVSEEIWGIVIYWQPGEYDNYWNLNNGKQLDQGEYQMIDLGISLIATQEQYESDAFGNDYDANAKADVFPEFAGGTASAPVVSDADGLTASEVTMTSGAVTAAVPAGVKLAEGVTELTLTVTPMDASGANITLSDNEVMRSLDVHIDGLAADNTVPVTVTLKEAAPTGLNMGNYALYHVEGDGTREMTLVEEFTAHNQFKYDPATGDIVLYMATFSEVAVVADTTKAWNGEADHSWYEGKESPYYIANADQLWSFSQIVGGMVKDIERDSFDSEIVKLVSDINLDDAEENNKSFIFYPIGYNCSDGTYDKTGVEVTTGFYPFEGTFDGQGHTIANFYQNTWEMKGDNEYYAASEQYYRDGMGLFGKVYGGTVKNLTVKNFKSDGEYTTTGVIAAYADGATFENIAITNCNPRVYNIGNGGIVGCVGWYAKEAGLKTTFKNITVDNSNKISALWGSYDVACGGIVGQYYPTSGQTSAGTPKNAGIDLVNCHVAAQMDVYNDVCGNYQYYAYRYAGMIIGSIRENTTNEDGKTIPDMTGISATGCTVNYGDWNDYYYCEFVKNGHPSYSGPDDYKFSRVPHSELNFTDSNGNGLVDADERASVTGCKHNHTDAENNKAIYLPFHQLFTGYGWGVNSIGLEEYSGITVKDFNLDVEEDKEHFAPAVKFGCQFPTAEVDKETGLITTDFLYRVGTLNEVAAGTLFNVLDGLTNPVNGSGVVVSVTSQHDDGINMGGFEAYTNDDDGDGDVEWEKGKITFNQTGIAKVTIQDYDYCTPTVLYVEVVDAKNITTATGSNGTDVVLLKNVKINSGATVTYDDAFVHGNGFTFDVRGGLTKYVASQGWGIINLSNGAVLDHMTIVGDVYNTFGAYTNNNYNTAAVASLGGTIQNCHISHCAAPVMARATTTIKDTTLYGGTVANLIIKSGISTLENVVTVNDNTIPDRSIVGMGIVVHSDADDTAKLVLNGTFKQYNFYSETDDPTKMDENAGYVYDAMFDNQCSQYHFGTFPNRNANTGIISMVDTFDESDISGTAKNSLGYTGKSISITIQGFNKTGYVYTQPNTVGTVDKSYDQKTDSAVQGDYLPTFKFNLGEQEISYDGDTDTRYLYGDVNGVDALYQDGDAVLTLDITKLATATKYGKSLAVTAACKDASGNMLTANNGVITLATSGKYTLVFTVTDNVFYDQNGNAVNQSVTRTYNVPLTLSVKAADWKNAEITISKTSLTGIWVKTGSVLDYNYKLKLKFLDCITVKDYSNATDKTGGSIDLTTNISSASLATPDSTAGNIWDSDFIVTITYEDGRELVVYFTDMEGDSPGTKTAKVETGEGVHLLTDGELNNKPTANTNNMCNCTITKVTYKGKNNATVTKETTVSVSWNGATEESGGCFAEGTMITLADGTQKRIEQITHEDKLLAWDFHTGTYVATTASLIESSDAGEYRVINLKFADGTVARIIDDHGFFDVEANNFVFIDEENVGSYIGHQFVKVGENGTYENVKLVGYEITVENVRYYTIQTVIYNNCIAEGMFTLTPPPEMLENDSWFDYFEIGEGMKYDEEKMQADIEKYGLYTYEEFAEYATYEQFVAFNGPYLKILVGRGVLTYEQILEILEQYKQWMT